MKKDEHLDALFDEILKLSSREECYSFFDDLCTIVELEAMSQRIQAAKMLLEGHTYEQIIEKTKISSTTLSRVSRCIRYGNGGYKQILLKK